jgi:hypothetical protein
VAETVAGNAQVRIFAGDGEGGFVPFAAGGVPLATPAATGPATQLLAADFNHDGVPDLAVVSASRVHVFLSLE